MKKIGFSTIALLAILLTSFRPAFAAGNIELTTVLRQETHKTTHQQSKFQTQTAVSSSTFTEADSEEADDADDEAGFQSIDFFFSPSSFRLEILPFFMSVEDPQLCGFITLTPKTNVGSLFLKHRQFLR